MDVPKIQDAKLPDSQGVQEVRRMAARAGNGIRRRRSYRPRPQRSARHAKGGATPNYAQASEQPRCRSKG